MASAEQGDGGGGRHGRRASGGVLRRKEMQAMRKQNVLMSEMLGQPMAATEQEVEEARAILNRRETTLLESAMCPDLSKIRSTSPDEGDEEDEEGDAVPFSQLEVLSELLRSKTNYLNLVLRREFVTARRNREMITSLKQTLGHERMQARVLEAKINTLAANQRAGENSRAYIFEKATEELKATLLQSADENAATQDEIGQLRDRFHDLKVKYHDLIASESEMALREQEAKQKLQWVCRRVIRMRRAARYLKETMEETRELMGSLRGEVPRVLSEVRACLSTGDRKKMSKLTLGMSRSRRPPRKSTGRSEINIEIPATSPVSSENGDEKPRKSPKEDDIRSPSPSRSPLSQPISPRSPPASPRSPTLSPRAVSVELSIFKKRALKDAMRIQALTGQVTQLRKTLKRCYCNIAWMTQQRREERATCLRALELQKRSSRLSQQTAAVYQRKCAELFEMLKDAQAMLRRIRRGSSGRLAPEEQHDTVSVGSGGGMHRAASNLSTNLSVLPYVTPPFQNRPGSADRLTAQEGSFLRPSQTAQTSVFVDRDGAELASPKLAFVGTFDEMDDALQKKVEAAVNDLRSLGQGYDFSSGDVDENIDDPLWGKLRIERTFLKQEEDVVKSELMRHGELPEELRQWMEHATSEGFRILNSEKSAGDGLRSRVSKHMPKIGQLAATMRIEELERGELPQADREPSEQGLLRPPMEFGHFSTPRGYHQPNPAATCIPPPALEITPEVTPEKRGEEKTGEAEQPQEGMAQETWGRVKEVEQQQEEAVAGPESISPTAPQRDEYGPLIPSLPPSGEEGLNASAPDGLGLFKRGDCIVVLRTIEFSTGAVLRPGAVGVVIKVPEGSLLTATVQVNDLVFDTRDGDVLPVDKLDMGVLEGVLCRDVYKRGIGQLTIARRRLLKPPNPSPMKFTSVVPLLRGGVVERETQTEAVEAPRVGPAYQEHPALFLATAHTVLGKAHSTVDGLTRSQAKVQDASVQTVHSRGWEVSHLGSASADREARKPPKPRPSTAGTLKESPAAMCRTWLKGHCLPISPAVGSTLGQTSSGEQVAGTVAVGTAGNEILVANRERQLRHYCDRIETVVSFLMHLAAKMEDLLSAPLDHRVNTPLKKRVNASLTTDFPTPGELLSRLEDAYDKARQHLAHAFVIDPNESRDDFQNRVKRFFSRRRRLEEHGQAVYLSGSAEEAQNVLHLLTPVTTGSVDHSTRLVRPATAAVKAKSKPVPTALPSRTTAGRDLTTAALRPATAPHGLHRGGLHMHRKRSAGQIPENAAGDGVD